MIDSCGNSIHFYKRNQLVVVPVIINDSLHLNMVLDPHCKTVIVFGRRLEKLIRASLKKVEGKEVIKGELFANNTVTLGPATRRNVSIAVIPNRDPMNFVLSINGIIGYDMLEDFQIITDKKHQIMTFIPIDRDQIFTSLPDKKIFNRP